MSREYQQSGTEPPRRSLRRLLMGWLVWPLATLIAASAIPAYFFAVGAANQAYDSALLDPALAITNHLSNTGDRVTINLPPEAFDVLRVDSLDRMYVQVRGPRDEVVAGTDLLPRPPEQLGVTGQLFYDAVLEGERTRVAARKVAHPLGTVIVQVAETYGKRDLMVREMLLVTLLSELAIAIAATCLLWYGIGRGLAPLEQLRDEIAARSPRDLRDVVSADKPAEVVPIITALNQLLGRLKASIEEQRRFIANAAHQLRTPLAGLKTHAELARRHTNPEELRGLLDMMAGETERTGHLVNQLLTLARAEPEATAARNTSPVNLHELCGRAVQSWLQRALVRNIDLGFELEDAWISGDALLMRELLANLLDNALAYTPDGGRVTVRTREDATTATIEVEDSGRGIPISERDRVFERFYRVQGTMGEGCGLGLAIVAEICTLHGGSVEIMDPAAPGTLIGVRLPALPRTPGTPPHGSALFREMAPSSR